MPAGVGVPASPKSFRQSSRTLTRSSTHSPVRAAPLRSTRTRVRPWFEASWLPAGTFSLQTYFTAFGPTTREWGTSRYTATGLSLVVGARSSAPRGNSRTRHAQARTGYVARSHACDLAAWMPAPRTTARRKRSPGSSATV